MAKSEKPESVTLQLEELQERIDRCKQVCNVGDLAASGGEDYDMAGTWEMVAQALEAISADIGRITEELRRPPASVTLVK